MSKESKTDVLAAHISAQEDAMDESHTAALQAIEAEREYLDRVVRAMENARHGRTYYRPPGRELATAEIAEFFQDVRTLATLRRCQVLQEEEGRTYTLARMMYDLQESGYHPIREENGNPIWGIGGLDVGDTREAHRNMRLEFTPEAWAEWDRKLEESFQAVRAAAADRAIGSITDLEG